MSEHTISGSPQMPRRLSWGRSSSNKSANRPAASLLVPAVGKEQLCGIKSGSTCSQGACSQTEAPCRDQQLLQQQQQLPVPSPVSSEQQAGLACRAILREVLSAVLGQTGPQLDHYQLTLPAVLGVLQHKLAEAATTGHSRGCTSAATAVKQQLAAAQKEAEAKVQKQLQDAAEKAAAAAAQHSSEVASLQVQLSTLQRQHKQVQGKSAQQARDLREAAEAAKAARAGQQLLQEEVQELKKQLQGKAAALARSTSVRQQEAVALKAELQQTAAAAEMLAAQHQQDLQQLQQAHKTQLAQLQAEQESNLIQQLAVAAAAHIQHQEELSTQLQEHQLQLAADVDMQLEQLREQHAELGQASLLAHQSCEQEMQLLVRCWQQQLQQVKAELHEVVDGVQAVTSLAGRQQQALLELQEQQDSLAPDGLAALAQQAQQAAAARADHAAALQQLQETSLQVATLQPLVQHLQQQQQVLGQERDALKAQLAEGTAAAAAAATQQELMAVQAAATSQQLAEATTRCIHLQQQLDAAQAELASAKQEAATARRQISSEGAAAQQLLVQATASHQAQVLSLAAAYSSDLQRLCERLQWLCSAYFSTAPGQTASDSATSCRPAELTSQPCTTTPAAAAAAATKAAASLAGPNCIGASQPQAVTCEPQAKEHCDASNSHPESGAAAAGLPANTVNGSSKLAKLHKQLAGDGECLLQLYEQYQQHKQELMSIAASGSHLSSTTPPDHEAPASTSTRQGSDYDWGSDSGSSGATMERYGAAAEPKLAACTSNLCIDITSSSRDTHLAGVCSDVLMPTRDTDSSGVWQAQQQVLQLEACLLNFMLSLQEAINEARQCHQQQQPRSTGLPHPMCAPRTSPSRLERPSTAASCSSRCTELSSLSSMRSCSSLGSQLLCAMRKEKQQLAQELRRLHSLRRTQVAATAAAAAAAATKVFPWQRSTLPSSSCSPGSQWMQVMVVGVPDQPGLAGDASVAEATQLPGQDQQHVWENVDEVLQLLQGCELNSHTSRQVGPAGCVPPTAPPQHIATSGATLKSSTTQQHGRAAAGPQAGALNASAAGSRAAPPSRTVSPGYSSTSPSGPPLLRKSHTSCATSSSGRSMQQLPRGTGILTLRK